MLLDTLDLAYKAGIGDFFKEGEKYGHASYPPSWMNRDEKSEYIAGKKYAMRQECKTCRA